MKSWLYNMKLFKFYSPTCAPCRAIEPSLATICEDKKIERFNINIDDSPEVIQDFGIKSVPTVILFEEGKELGRFIGFKTEKEILSWVEKSSDNIA